MSGVNPAAGPSAHRLDSELLGRLATVGPPAALGLLLIALAATTPSFTSLANIQAILLQAAPLVVLGTGLTFIVMLGSIDLSVGSVMAAATVAAGALLGSLGYLAFAVALALGAFAGLLNGLLLTKGRIPSFIATLAGLGVWLAVAYLITGGPPVELTLDAVTKLDFLAGYVGSVPASTVIAGAVLAAAWFVERKTRFGRFVLAIGASEPAARLSGVDVQRVKVLAFVVGGLCAAIGGILLLAINDGSATPRSGDPFLLPAIAAVVVGGTPLTGGGGSLLRTLVGALAIAIIGNALTVRGVDPFAQQAATGAIIIIAAGLTLNRAKLEVIK